MNDDIKSVKQRFGIRGNGLNIEIERALIAAKTNSPVLIQGESGTGKEVFPKIIHFYSNRKNKNFIAINCGSIPEGTIDSELFGHEKGSFTGAIAERKGYFEECDGGTIFLDEIGEMPLSTQARLLRVLESGEFIRVGSSKVIKTDVRIVAATNINVAEAVRNGKFREDLYYRINTIPIKLKPLRQRTEDIPVLFNYFVCNFAEKNSISNSDLVKFDSTAIDYITNANWSGNVRQLKNVAEQIALFEMGRTLSAKDMEQYVPRGNVALQRIGGITSDTEYLALKMSELDARISKLESIYTQLTPIIQAMSHNLTTTEPERVQPLDDHPDIIDTDATEIKTINDIKIERIQESLERNHNNKRKTANELGISERQLYRIINKYGLSNK